MLTADDEKNVEMRWLGAETLESDGVMVTTHLDPPPIGEPRQLSAILTSKDVNEVMVTLADTPSQSKETESPSTTTRPLHATDALLAGAVAACDTAAMVAARTRKM